MPKSRKNISLDWQPIKNAPKEGFFDVWTGTHRIMDCWRSENKIFRLINHKYQIEAEVRDAEYFIIIPEKPKD